MSGASYSGASEYRAQENAWSEKTDMSDEDRKAARQLIVEVHAKSGIKAAREAAEELFGPVGYLTELVVAIRESRAAVGLRSDG